MYVPSTQVSLVHINSFIIFFFITKTDLATEKQHTKGRFIQQATTNSKTERFVDELKEGVLIHAKTTVPAETFSREKMCKLKAPSHCLVGIPCPDNLPFSDALHKDNVFHNEKGEFCNCWMNRKVDTYWLPKLKDALIELEVVGGIVMNINNPSQ